MRAILVRAVLAGFAAMLLISVLGEVFRMTRQGPPRHDAADSVNDVREDAANDSAVGHVGPQRPPPPHLNPPPHLGPPGGTHGLGGAVPPHESASDSTAPGSRPDGHGPSRRPPYEWLLLQLMLGGLTFAGVVFWIARPIFEGLDVLEKTSSQIAAGDLTARSRLVDGPVGGLGAQFDAMTEQVERNVRRQRELLAAVSHELRTPMARIRFLLEDVRDAETAGAERIDDELDTMDELLSELLELARQETPPSEPSEPAATEEVVSNICERLSGLSGVPVHVDVAGELQIGRRALLLITSNLVSNATRHAESKVRVRVRDKVLTVDDDGPGVPAADRQRVFEAFHTGDTARNRSLGGVGLGLALVSRAAARWGATVRVEDSDLGGARFVVEWTE